MLISDGRTEPNLDDLGLAFREMGISISELEEFINSVDSGPFPHQVPAVPVSRQSNLNFLKPGSRETLSRPVHIHEHLPPMHPEKEGKIIIYFFFLNKSSSKLKYNFFYY